MQEPAPGRERPARCAACFGGLGLNLAGTFQLTAGHSPNLERGRAFLVPGELP
jgi:hypothetical protein